MISLRQIEDANGDADLMDYAQAPSTPGLIEEPNLSNIQETSACDDHIESEDNHLMESAVKKNLENASCRLNLHQGNKHVMGWTMPNGTNSDLAPGVPCEENGFHSSDVGIKDGLSPTVVNVEHVSSDDHAIAEVGVIAQKPRFADNTVAASDSLDREEEFRNGDVKIDGVDIPSVDLSHDCHGQITGVISGSERGDVDASGLASPRMQVSEDGGQKSNNVKNAGKLERPSSPRDALEFGADLLVASGLEKPESLTCEEPKDSQVSNLVPDNGIPCGQVHVLRPCNAELGEFDSSHAVAEQHINHEPSDIASVPLETSKMVEIMQASGDSTVVQGLCYNMIMNCK